MAATLPRAGRFALELDYDAGELRQHYRLNGEVAGGHVRATETLENSDAPPLAYQGDADPPGAPGGCLRLHHGDRQLLICQTSPA